MYICAWEKEKDRVIAKIIIKLIVAPKIICDKMWTICILFFLHVGLLTFLKGMAG